MPVVTSFPSRDDNQQFQSSMQQQPSNIHGGKCYVRVMKVSKRDNDDNHQDLKEVRAQVLLKGDFDNGEPVVPLDTVKNTIYELSKTHSLDPIEDFALLAAQNFFMKFENVASCSIDIDLNEWSKINQSQGKIQGFQHSNDYIRYVSLYAIRGKEPQLCSGIKALDIVKTANSSFDISTFELKENLMRTKIYALWKYGNEDVDYNLAFTKIKDIIIEGFVTEGVSKGAQQTLYDMCNLVLENVPQVQSVYISAPEFYSNAEDLESTKGMTEACLSRNNTTTIKNLTATIHQQRHNHHHLHWGNHFQRMNRRFYASKL
ncbi:hypothetical protein ABK040_006132 [Willaertia magna]